MLIILGMHRSGTSCLAGSLQQAGFAAGTVEDWNPDNLRGNRENVRIIKLNDDLLQNNHGSWERPPVADTLQIDGNLRIRRAEILQELSSAERPCLFKDPRSLLTLPFWLEAIPDPRRIGVFRHPLRVAQSLYLRNKKPLAEGLKLWLSYNRALLAVHERAPFPIVCFDLPPDEFLASLEDAVKQECGDLVERNLLDLGQLRIFYSSELVHHQDSRTEEIARFDAGITTVMREATDVYARLLELAKAAPPSHAQPAAVKDDSIAQLLAADRAAESGNIDEALRRYRTAVASSSNPRSVWERIIKLLKTSGRKEMLLEACNVAVNAWPDDAGLLLLSAEAKRHAGLIEEALAEAERASLIAPNLIRPWIIRGDCLRAAKRWSEAIPCFRRALELQPSGVFLINAWLGDALIRSGHREEGESTFQQALDLAPPENRANVLHLWAEALIAQSEFIDALPYLKTAASISNNPGIHIALVQLLHRLSKTGEAVRHLHDSIKKGVDSPQLRSMLGNIEAKLKS